jgi:hypothetical protein
LQAILGQPSKCKTCIEKMRLLKPAFIAIVCLILTSCGTSKKLNNLSVGMTTEQVKKTVGTNYVLRGSIINKFDQKVEVWEYKLSQPGYVSLKNYYWLYIVDGKLSQWGQAGDWSREADRIYEIRFR